MKISDLKTADGVPISDLDLSLPLFWINIESVRQLFVRGLEQLTEEPRANDGAFNIRINDLYSTRRAAIEAMISVTHQRCNNRVLELQAMLAEESPCAPPSS